MRVSKLIIGLLSIFIACISSFPLYSVESGDIVVHLPTDKKLLSIYISEAIEDQWKFSHSHLKDLESILEFDLAHSGLLESLPRDVNIEKILSKGSFEGSESVGELQKSDAYYIIRLQARKNVLQSKVIHLSSQKATFSNPIILSGDLNRDRKLIHQLSDFIHQQILSYPGIASTRILYTIRVPGPTDNNWLSEVWECDWDGANARQVSQENAYCVTPKYLNAGLGKVPSHYFYVSYRTGQPKIYIGSLKGKDSQRFTTLRGNQLMPIASNARDKVAFISDATGNPDLFLQDFTPEAGPIGKPRQIYATVRGTQASPTFSPNGDQIAFVSNKSGSPRIYIMEVPEGRAHLGKIHTTLISKLNRENTAPSWSPDGKKIAYSAKTNGTRQIWVYDNDTKREMQITSGPGNKENPSWAPNSLHIVFDHNTESGSELFMVNLNQPKAVQLSSGKGEKRFPDWSPRLLSE
ncbi:MAG: translocation protein TolB [Waddliaceae bacterium]|nr:translocation protein TolB [Waddliaceae bacterium]